MYQQISPSNSGRSARGNKLVMISPICCFRSNPSESDSEESPPRTPPRSPYTWLKSTANELEIRKRCRRVKARIQGSYKTGCNNHHQQRQNHGSSDFSYDPFSYALNFEDDDRADNDQWYPSFMARLPASPKVVKAETMSVRLPVTREMMLQVC